jgi:tetratricopeptide (TPR) repeat protein
MSNSVLGRRWKALVSLALVLALAGGAGAWWYQTSQPEYRMRAGHEALQHGKPDQAEKVVLRLEADGYTDYAHLLRGEIHLREHRYDQALAEFNRIQDQGQIRLEAAALSGQCLLYLQQPREAARVWRFVVAQSPDNVDANRGLAALYFDQGALPLALRYAEQWARLDPDDGRPHRFMGRMYNDLYQNAEAVTAYRAALQRQLSAAVAEEVRQELAECLIKQTEYARALEVLEGCDPEKVVALRAEALWGLGRLAEARKLLDHVLPDGSSSSDLIRLRAKVYLAEDEPQAAAPLLERALRMDRHDHQSRYLLSQVYERLGRHGEAAEQQLLCQQTQDLVKEMRQLNQKVMNDPWDGSSRVQLAAVCQKLDKPILAEMWQKAAAACPPGPADKVP